MEREIIMIDVYFMLKGKGECVGAISLSESDPDTRKTIWNTYKVFPINKNMVVLKRPKSELYILNGKGKHEMGQIKIQYINEWININVTEN